MTSRQPGPLFILLLILIIMACSLFTSAPAHSRAEIEKEEQAVYSFFVGDQGPVVILENTATDISEDDPGKTLDYIQSGLPDISKQTLDSFLERNESPDPLSTEMDLGVDYILLSPDELSEITRQPNWPEIMAERYDGAVGYTVFSRVGFNKSLDQAVIYVGQMAGPLMGAGYYYLLEKHNGEWKLTGEIMVWIS
jgi:hypothetical protein